jgi:hypothetical protein
VYLFGTLSQNLSKIPQNFDGTNIPDLKQNQQFTAESFPATPPPKNQHNPKKTLRIQKITK